MKCISNVVNDKLVMKRVKDGEAELLVDTKGWKYVSKSKFREFKNPPKAEEGKS